MRPAFLLFESISVIRISLFECFRTPAFRTYPDTFLGTAILHKISPTVLDFVSLSVVGVSFAKLGWIWTFTTYPIMVLFLADSDIESPSVRARNFGVEILPLYVFRFRLVMATRDNTSRTKPVIITALADLDKMAPRLQLLFLDSGIT